MKLKGTNNFYFFLMLAAKIWLFHFLEYIVRVSINMFAVPKDEAFVIERQEHLKNMKNAHTVLSSCLQVSVGSFVGNRLPSYGRCWKVSFR